MCICKRYRGALSWTKLWRRVTDRECLSLGAVLQPLIGGVLIGLWNVLQPYCLGEGTNFFQYLFLGVNQHTLKPKTMIGICTESAVIILADSDPPVIQGQRGIPRPVAS